ncbi:MAG: trigger factor [Faecalibacterium sp.]
MKLLTVEYPQENVCQLTLTATGEELETAAAIVYERNGCNFKLKGIEKGEASRAEIEAERGEHVFWYDAINDIMDADVPALFDQTVDELNLEVVSEPGYDLVSVNKEEGFTATATFCLLPKFEIGNYIGIEVSATPTYVTEEQIQHYIERKQRLNAELVPHKGPAVKNDTVHITYLGLVDGKPFQGGSAENSPLVLGQGRMIPGFEEAIIGHCAGDAFDIEVTFPDNYRQKELAGKPAIFKTKLIDACAKELPALNCDFARKLGEVDTMEEYHEVVLKQLQLLRYNNAKNQAKTKVLSSLDALIVGEPPEPMVTAAYSQELQNLQQMLQQSNMTKARYLQMMKKTDEEFAAETRDKARRGVRINLALLQIAKENNFVPTVEEMDKRLEESAAKGKKTLEELKAATNYKTYAQSIARKAAVDYVIDSAAITITEPEQPPVK